MKNNKIYEEMTTLELIKSLIISKLPRGKQKLVNEQEKANNPPQDTPINYIAVILDENVEEVLRCENRLAALLLSDPTFVEFDPKTNYPKVGLTKYVNGNFVNLKEQEGLLAEDKIEELLDSLENKND